MERTVVSGRRRHALLGLAALLLLLVAVAVASTGSVPAGSSGSRRPAERFVDVAVSLFMVLMVAGIGLWIYLIVIRKDVVVESILARRSRPRWPAYVTLAVGFTLLAILVRWLSVDESLRRFLQDRLSATQGRTGLAGTAGAAGSTRPTPYEPQFTLLPVLVLVGLLLAAAIAWYVSQRARRRRLPPLEETLLPTLTDLLEDTLDDLRAETDPRRAVIAAYARMEKALAAFGLPRHPFEAPDEYLHRIFDDLEVSRRSTSRLTALFAWAKFSGHDVAPEMKDEAIAALESVRDELRAFEIFEEERSARARAELQEHAR
jgi:hypothetical protein